MNYPLFWLLEPEGQVRLVNYQWETYGMKLDIPPDPIIEHPINYNRYTIGNIQKYMSRKPKQKRVN